MKRTIAILFASSLLFAACDSPKPSTEAPEEHAHDEHETKGNDGHAPQGYVAGSHDDWCGEHQVPESMCTRCNKSLIAGFKVSGDWCDEHELPKSQCLACDPNLEIVRPPKESK